ncbi:MAG: FtsQ-type POTRA domain-containing protein [Gemmatimonadetes bacterium]|nr:FtsQ-type POTRA domain-containing protein [Gemmatimonadota bacterium]
MADAPFDDFDTIPEPPPTERGRGRATPAVSAAPERPRWKKRLRAVLFLCGGTRYVSPDQIVSRLGVDSTASVFDDVEPFEKRVRLHPSVRDVHISRRLPGTLVVRITENLPVALVPAASGLVPVDAVGRSLPVDPTTADMDLPVLASRDIAALALLGDLRDLAPGLFARVGEIRRLPKGDLLVRLNESGTFAILAASGVTAQRLTDVIPVEQDLINRNQRATELDLRYRDQVIARLP